jgi:two-component system chemotaxis sensor kinase CheA
VAALRGAWDGVISLAAALESGSGHDRIEIHVREYEEHLAQLKARRCDDALLATVRAWTNEPAKRALERLAEQGQSLARRLGKGETTIDVRIVPPTLRLPPTRWAPVWAVLSHVLRNTLDHGIESADERRGAQKPLRGRVEITLTAEGGGVALSVADDGRGIDWDKVRERARRVGIPHATEAELEEALYADNVTTKDQATEISGRGIGMGAVRDVVQSRGGTMSVESRRGAGTTITCSFPSTMIDGPRFSHSLAPKVA